MTTQFVTPVGRLVQGDVFKGDTKNMTGQPRVTKSGAPAINFFLALAVPKHEAGPMIETIKAAAAEGFRNGETGNPSFSWKYVDGDSTVPNRKGKKPCDQEGFPGHVVFRFNSGFAPRVYDEHVQEIIDPSRVKLGDYARISGTVQGNGQAVYPGVFLSHNMIQVVRAGERIVTGPDPMEVFGAQALGTIVSAPAVTPRQLPPPPPPPPPNSGPRMAVGCPYTYDQLKAQGWTDAQMVAQGYLITADSIPF